MTNIIIRVAGRTHEGREALKEPFIHFIAGSRAETQKCKEVASFPSRLKGATEIPCNASLSDLSNKHFLV